MTTVANTLAERGARYGAFADHARISQGLLDVLRAAPNWGALEPDMKQALSTICDKFARILNGDPYYADNWHDIQGYAKLVEDRVTKDIPVVEAEVVGEAEPELLFPSASPLTQGGFNSVGVPGPG